MPQTPLVPLTARLLPLPPDVNALAQPFHSLCGCMASGRASPPHVVRWMAFSSRAVPLPPTPPPYHLLWTVSAAQPWHCSTSGCVVDRDPEYPIPRSIARAARFYRKFRDPAPTTEYWWNRMASVGPLLGTDSRTEWRSVWAIPFTDDGRWGSGGGWRPRGGAPRRRGPRRRLWPAAGDASTRRAADAARAVGRAGPIGDRSRRAVANGVGPSPCGGARRGPRRAPGRLFPPSTGDPGVWSHSRAPRRGAPHRRRWTSGRLLTMGDGPLARPVKASAPAFSITAVSKNIVPTCCFLNGARVAACILNGARVAACILNGARVAACDPSALLQCERGATPALFDPLDPMGQKVLPSRERVIQPIEWPPSATASSWFRRWSGCLTESPRARVILHQPERPERPNAERPYRNSIGQASQPRPRRPMGFWYGRSAFGRSGRWAGVEWPWVSSGRQTRSSFAPRRALPGAARSATFTIGWLVSNWLHATSLGITALVACRGDDHQAFEKNHLFDWQTG